MSARGMVVIALTCLAWDALLYLPSPAPPVQPAPTPSPTPAPELAPPNFEDDDTSTALVRLS